MIQMEGMLQIIGNISLKGKIFWHINGGQELHQEDGLKVSFPFSSSSGLNQDKRSIKKYIEAAIKKEKILWITPGSKEWIFDLDELKVFFSELSSIEWLKGKVSIEPDLETVGFSSHISRTSLTGLQKILSFYISPEELGKVSEHSAIELFARLNLHKKVIISSRNLFKDGHYRQCVHEATIALENYIKNKAGSLSEIGQKLMFKVFDENNPIIKISDCKTVIGKDEQAGIKFLSVGIIRGFKNVYSHSDKQIKDPLKALRILSIISYIFETIDKNDE